MKEMTNDNNNTKKEQFRRLWDSGQVFLKQLESQTAELRDMLKTLEEIYGGEDENNGEQ